MQVLNKDLKCNLNLDMHFYNIFRQMMVENNLKKNGNNLLDENGQMQYYNTLI